METRVTASLAIFPWSSSYSGRKVILNARHVERSDVCSLRSHNCIRHSRSDVIAENAWLSKVWLLTMAENRVPAMVISQSSPFVGSTTASTPDLFALRKLTPGVGLDTVVLSFRCTQLADFLCCTSPVAIGCVVAAGLARVVLVEDVAVRFEKLGDVVPKCWCQFDGGVGDGVFEQ